MLEKIGAPGYERLSHPRETVLRYVETLKAGHAPITVAEIGVGIGGTTLGIHRLLSREDTLYLFDYTEVAQELCQDFLTRFPEGPRVLARGNSHRRLDSYVWELGELCAQGAPLFDLVFLDGAHSFPFDGLACCCLKELLKPRGYLILDDVSMKPRETAQKQPDLREELESSYTQAQMDIPQIAMVERCLLQPDLRFTRRDNLGSTDMSVYQKIC